MGYQYGDERHKIFTDEGQRDFLKVRDMAKRLLDEAGAFKMPNVLRGITGDSWAMMANVDRLVELGEIKEIYREDVCGQDRVFVSGKGGQW